MAVSASSKFKRLLIGRLKRLAAASNVSLLSQIDSEADALLDSMRGGTLLKEARGNGNLAMIELVAEGIFDPMRAAEVLDDLKTICQRAAANLIAAGTPNPSDTDILAEVLGDAITGRLGLLEVASDIKSDYSSMRYPP